MSPRRRAVKECCSISSHGDHRDTIFHSIPLNLRNVWLKNCRLSTTTTIAKDSRHVRHEAYHLFKNNKYRLRPGAVPTVFSLIIANAASTSSSVRRSDWNRAGRVVPKVMSSPSINLEKLSPFKQAVNRWSVIVGKNLALTNLILEMNYSLPTSEILRPYVNSILAVMFNLLQLDNEENVRIIIELHKQYRPAFTQNVRM